MANTLKYSTDEFKSQTADSCEKAVKVFSFHDYRSKLFHELFPEDELFTLIYNRTHPLAIILREKAALVKTVEDVQVGQTESVNIILAQITGAKGNARDWYNRTAAIYAISNPARMKTIWNQGLKPFRGKKDDIINAVKTLSDNIGDDDNALMIAIKAEVDDQYAILNPTREQQLEDIGATAIRQMELDTACSEAMEMEYRNAGLLMDKYPKNENNIQESFHDMELLLSKQQTEWNITLAGAEIKDIATRTQAANSKFTATAIGGDAKMYLASTPGGTDSTAVTFTNGVKKAFTAASFGVSEYGKNRHITVVSQSQISIAFKLKLG